MARGILFAQPKEDKPEPVQMREVISHSRICPHCMHFCKEIKPLFRRGGAARYFRQNGCFPESRVFCPNGCTILKPNWGWINMGDPETRYRHIPGTMTKEWSTKIPKKK